MNLLSIEYDKITSKLLQTGLNQHGFSVKLCHDGNKGLERASNQSYDAILLDIMLPGLDGLSLLRALRERKNSTPVIILSARGEVAERVAGLDAGADDYVTKPFVMEELVARLRALLRRVSGESISVYRIGTLTLDLIRRKCRRREREVVLSRVEFCLLENLMRMSPKPMTRTKIIERVWEGNFDFTSNLVDVFITRLRRKIDHGEEVKMIQTVRNVGYRLHA